MKKVLINNIGFKILSLIFAIALWIIVVNIDDPDVTRTFSGIPVTTLDENVITGNNQVYSIASGNSVNVTVKGPRSMVDKMTKDDFYAQAPFSEMSNVNAVPIYVLFRNSKYERDCEITQNTMNMKLNVEDLIEKNFDVEIVHSGELSSSYYLAKESVSFDKVTVKAPESKMRLVDSVEISVDLSGKTDSFTAKTDLKCYTASGVEISDMTNIGLSQNSTDYQADIYQVKEVPVKIGTTGVVASGYTLTGVTSDKTTLKIAGPSANQVDSIVFPDELLNIQGANKDVSVDADVTVLLPSGVYLYNKSDATIKITAKVEAKKTNTYTIPISEIDKNNIPQGFSAEIVEKSIDITVSGIDKNLSDFSVNKLEPYVDLKNTVEGNNEVIVHFTLPEGLSLVDDVKINVVMKNNTVQESTQQDTVTN